MFENSIFKIEFSILLGLFPHHNLYRLTFQSFVLRELLVKNLLCFVYTLPFHMYLYFVSQILYFIVLLLYSSMLGSVIYCCDYKVQIDFIDWLIGKEGKKDIKKEKKEKTGWKRKGRKGKKEKKKRKKEKRKKERKKQTNKLDPPKKTKKRKEGLSYQNVSTDMHNGKRTGPNRREKMLVFLKRKEKAS